MKWTEYEKIQDLILRNKYSFDDLFDFKKELPSKERIFQGRKVAEWDVPIRRLTIVLSASAGAGKDHTYRYFINQTKEKYDDVKVHVEHKDMNQYFDNVTADPIQIFVFPDITDLINSKFKTINRRWVLRRHEQYEKMQEEGSGYFGLRMDILVMHRIHGVPPILSTDIDWLAVKSRPDNDFDREVIRSRFGDDGLIFLQQLEKKRESNDHYIGYGIIRTKSKEQVFYNSLIVD